VENNVTAFGFDITIYASGLWAQSKTEFQ
jgi:hypothetical protein